MSKTECFKKMLKNNKSTIENSCIPLMWLIRNRYLSRFFDCLAHPNLSATLATDSLISTLVNGTVPNFGKRYKDN